ncbi:MAG: peroxidase [Omnitrophica WOR_2 bacterium RIFCSPHIGHO2_02_FULL_52_10]|nr:MAG: peroxidase [Omnitrophica WOR_2 bacterium RIFCSPHIGHO2_02_FULL_52_10]
MSLRLGDIAPDFTAETTEGIVHFHQWIEGRWAVLFSHPKDFTPVCTTELGKVAKIKSEFDKRGVKIIGISVDSLQSHKEWIKDINETQHATMNYPLIADPQRIVAMKYDMLDVYSPDNLTARSVFVIGPDKKIKLMITYPASTGRNFEEILRAIDSVQLTANYSVATPADWKNGEDCIIVPSVKDEEIKAKFPKGHNRLKPYLRTTPQPNI